VGEVAAQAHRLADRQRLRAAGEGGLKRGDDIVKWQSP
jgi:hypothetical protein